jgi:hypothetical protein
MEQTGINQTELGKIGGGSRASEVLISNYKLQVPANTVSENIDLTVKRLPETIG